MAVPGRRVLTVLAACTAMTLSIGSAFTTGTTAASPQLRGFATNIFGAQTLGTLAFEADALDNYQLNDFYLFSALELDTPEAIANITPELTEMKAAGAQVIRLTFPWTTLETQPHKPGDPPDFNWLAADRITAFLAETSQLGLKVIVNFSNTPCGRSAYPLSFSSSQYKDCTHLGPWALYPPANTADIGNAVAEVIRRWGADLYAIEVWNEPNGGFFLSDINTCDPSDPAALVGPSALATRAQYYVPMVKSVYQAVKSSAFPGIKVIADDSAFSDNTFLQDLYADGIAGNYDALSIHPYHLWLRWVPTPTGCPRSGSRLIWTAQDPATPFPDPEFSFTTGVQQIHNTMVASGDSSPLWFTEFGFESCIVAPAALQGTAGQTSPGSDATGACTGLTNQASWLSESYQIAAQWPYVAVAAMYTSRDGVAGEDPYSPDSFGLLRHDYTPKPSYVSVRNEWACLAAGTC